MLREIFSRRKPADTKSQRNSKVEAAKLYDALAGLTVQFEANGLDSREVRKAASCLSGLADEVRRASKA